MKAEVEKPCVKCGSRIFYVYVKARRCVECANQQSARVRDLRKKVQALEATLKSIDTWARFDLKEGRRYALTPEDVVTLCRKHF